MERERAVGRLAAALTLAVVVACGRSEEADQPGFPSRDWSGEYALEVEGAETDCQGEAPDLQGVTLVVTQSVENDVEMEIGPLIRLTGRLDGNDVRASGSIEQPVPLPDSLATRATVADSLESVDYRLEGRFEEEGALKGRYRIRTADLVALARGSGPHRCTVEYEVRGVPVTKNRPAP